MSNPPETKPAGPRIVEVRKQILKKNDELARAFRARAAETGCYVVSLVSSPGTGKTEFLKQTLAGLVDRFRVAALVGDLATDNDADRLAVSGAPARQITTGTVCHLETDMVESALAEAQWSLDELDFLFVENVGNLVCPSSFDLGEDLRVVLVSTTEGEDKPRKYPTIFNTSDVAVITKMDLAGVLEFDRAAMRASVEAVRPGMAVHEVSAKSGAGMEGWIDALVSARAVARDGAPAAVAAGG
ncbi:MAG: hydrogenase nickel incorporation protein HypB [Planctomycetota bacterium]